MLTTIRERVRCSAATSPSGTVTFSLTLNFRRGRKPTALVQRQTPPEVITALRNRGLSLGDIGRCVGARRGRVGEWQRGVHGMSHGNWARLTALRDVAESIAGNGMDIRPWLFAYNSALEACPADHIARDQFTAVLQAAQQGNLASTKSRRDIAP